jgi:hypothetical protein
MSSGMPFGNNSVLGNLLSGGAESTGRKEKLPAYIPSDLLDRLRDTVVALQRTPSVEQPPLSLSSFVEAAVQRAVEDAEAEYNKGQRFPTRPHRHLKTGPPIQS